jgi:hypothetical protein
MRRAGVKPRAEVCGEPAQGRHPRDACGNVCIYPPYTWGKCGQSSVHFGGGLSLPGSCPKWPGFFLPLFNFR